MPFSDYLESVSVLQFPSTSTSDKRTSKDLFWLETNLTFQLCLCPHYVSSSVHPYQISPCLCQSVYKVLVWSDLFLIFSPISQQKKPDILEPVPSESSSPNEPPEQEPVPSSPVGIVAYIINPYHSFNSIVGWLAYRPDWLRGACLHTLWLSCPVLTLYMPFHESCSFRFDRLLFSHYI